MCARVREHVACTCVCVCVCLYAHICTPVCTGMYVRTCARARVRKRVPLCVCARSRACVCERMALLSVPFLCGQEEYEKFHTSSSIPAGMLFFRVCECMACTGVCCLHTHTHTGMCLCVCVCACVRRAREHAQWRIPVCVCEFSYKMA